MTTEAESAAACRAYDAAIRATDPQGYIEMDNAGDDAMRAALEAAAAVRGLGST